jgi:hypothetical protein
MWSLVWQINKQIKRDNMFFESKTQAENYANYYKELLDAHNQLNYIQKRFGINKPTQFKIQITYKLISTTPKIQQ